MAASFRLCGKVPVREEDAVRVAGIVARQAPQTYGPQPTTTLVKVVEEVAGGNGHGGFVVHVPEKMMRYLGVSGWLRRRSEHPHNLWRQEWPVFIQMQLAERPSQTFMVLSLDPVNTAHVSGADLILSGGGGADDWGHGVWLIRQARRGQRQKRGMLWIGRNPPLPEVPPCKVIVGPGNRWVTAAKLIVSVDDSTADLTMVALDPIVQPEHNIVACAILVGDDPALQSLGRRNRFPARACRCEGGECCLGD